MHWFIVAQSYKKEACKLRDKVWIKGRLSFYLSWPVYFETLVSALVLFLRVTHCAGSNIGLPSNNNISKTVEVNCTLTMFLKECLTSFLIYQSWYTFGSLVSDVWTWKNFSGFAEKKGLSLLLAVLHKLKTCRLKKNLL